MKVKCIKEFYDLERQTNVALGDEFEVSAARGKELTTAYNKAGCVLCEALPEPTTEKVEAAPKSRSKKKEV